MDALQRLTDTDDPELQQEQYYALLDQFIEARDRIGFRAFPLPLYVGFCGKRHVFDASSVEAAFTVFIFYLAGWKALEAFRPDDKEVRRHILIHVPQERYVCQGRQSRFVAISMPRRENP